MSLSQPTQESMKLVYVYDFIYISLSKYRTVWEG